MRKASGASRVQIDEHGAKYCPDCGCMLDDHRSLPHHNAFFAFLQHCFDTWPENVEFQPETPYHLRSWLLVKAKHRAPHFVYQPEPFDEEEGRELTELEYARDVRRARRQAEAELAHKRQHGKYGWLVIVGRGFAVLKPASIAWANLSQKEFNKISGDVIRVLRDYAGLDFHAWKNMGGRKAA